MLKLDNEVKEQVRKKFKHWMDDLHVLVMPSIMSSLFFGTRRSSAAFYNPVVAFKDIHGWLSNVCSQIEKSDILAKLLTEEAVNRVKHAYTITDPHYLGELKHRFSPIKDIQSLYGFIVMHYQLVEDLWSFYHRMEWLLEKEFQLEG
jgi:hypothetical protein